MSIHLRAAAPGYHIINPENIFLMTKVYKTAARNDKTGGSGQNYDSSNCLGAVRCM